MQISIVGTGYVGLVTGVALSEIGHKVTCIDIDENKVKKMLEGISPIYEPGLEELMIKNIKEKRLNFTTDHASAFKESEVIYIAVGTPQKDDGTAELKYVKTVAEQIAENLSRDTIVVTKSTVPIGTNYLIKEIIDNHKTADFKVEVVSNPEFLREGSAVYDTFHGDRIVIGADSKEAAEVVRKINEPFGIPIFMTDISSAEMIKYASNAFLATKISFINEIANLCSKFGANIDDVSAGMGMDQRIGSQFLKAGIGYGGSCFPKDTHALVQIAKSVDYSFELLEAVIKVNDKQQRLMMYKLRELMPSLKDKKIALLGLSFKPNTDDMRESAAIVLSEELLKEGAKVFAYDPIALENAKNILSKEVQLVASVEEALRDADAVIIVTDWDEFKQIKPEVYEKLMKKTLILDGRNCYSLESMKSANVEYYSVGRPSVLSSN